MMNIRMASVVLIKTLTGLMCCLLVSVGCSRGKKEPKITGKPSDPPVSLHCAWQAGNCYHLRLEMAVLTDSPALDPKEKGLHRVTFAQECLVTATNAVRGKAGNIGLDMEILSLAMERARGTQVALSFDSEQGGETSDDLGYVPILDALIGGRLHFLLSPDGKMLRAEGIPEWLAHAMGDAPMRKPTSRTVLNDPPLGTNAGSMTNSASTNMTRKAARAMRVAAAASASPTAAASRRTAGSTLRTFFNPDLFRQMLEFNFLPAAPVRVGEEWKSQGDTPINGRGRYRFDATSKFEGWQQHGQTNCARVAVRGALGAQGNSTTPAAGQKQDPLKGTIWIDQQLGFPVATVLDSQVTLSTKTAPPPQGTNNLGTNDLARSVRQNVSITLLEITPIEGAPADSAPAVSAQ